MTFPTFNGRSVFSSTSLRLVPSRRRRPLSLVRSPSVGRGRIPGFAFAGFHYVVATNNTRMIGVPLWLPSGVCLVALLAARRRVLHPPPFRAICPFTSPNHAAVGRA